MFLWQNGQLMVALEGAKHAPQIGNKLGSSTVYCNVDMCNERTVADNCE